MYQLLLAILFAALCGCATNSRVTPSTRIPAENGIVLIELKARTYMPFGDNVLIDDPVGVERNFKLRNAKTNEEFRLGRIRGGRNLVALSIPAGHYEMTEAASFHYWFKLSEPRLSFNVKEGKCIVIGTLFLIESYDISGLIAERPEDRTDYYRRGIAAKIEYASTESGDELVKEWLSSAGGPQLNSYKCESAR